MVGSRLTAENRRIKRMWTVMATVFALTVVAFGAAALAPSAAATAATWSCTATAYNTCTFSSDPGWDEYNNPWNNPAMPPNSYTMHVDSHSRWEAVANQEPCPTSDCAVEAYDSSQYNYDNQSGSQTIADINSMSSTFDLAMPTGNLGTNGLDAEAAYDIWLNNYAIEVMIWVDNQGQTPAGSVVGTTTLSGQTYQVYQAGQTYSFVLDHNVTRGTVNILTALQYLTSNGHISNSSYMTQFNFGFEICSTGGATDTFTINDLTLSQSFS